MLQMQQQQAGEVPRSLCLAAPVNACLTPANRRNSYSNCLHPEFSRQATREPVARVNVLGFCDKLAQQGSRMLSSPRATPSVPCPL